MLLATLANSTKPFVLCGSNAHKIPPIAVSTFGQYDFYPCDVGCDFSGFWREGLIQTQPTENSWIATAHQAQSAGASADNAIEDLRTVVAMIREGHLLPAPSDGFDELLTRAIAARGTPTNIDAWAQQLADHVGDLTD